MATLSIDTYDFVAGLKEAGIPEPQAVAIADNLKKVNLEHVATKEDVAELRIEIQRMKVELLKWVVPLLLAQIGVFAGVVKYVGM
ncbi:MAG: hypothetical protein AB7K24_07285 [Gemmataceae bacterium]